MNTAKRILLTGATGLIGKDAIEPLLDLGYEIHALTIDDNSADERVTWHKVNLFDTIAVERTVETIRPTHLLNFAWAATGDYLTSAVNYKFLAAGLDLLSAFVKNGGQRAVYVGTCFEYKIKDGPLRETDELDTGKTTYTFCKDLLHQAAERLCRESGVSFGYGRIFYVYGRNEDPRRLCGSIVDHLRRGERVTVTGGRLMRDYMYTKDIATAFAKFVNSPVTGTVNIGTGHGIAIEDLAHALGDALGRPDLIDYQPNPGKQPPSIVADITRLRGEVGFTSAYSHKSACRDLSV